jgi:Peptidase family M23
MNRILISLLNFLFLSLLNTSNAVAISSADYEGRAPVTFTSWGYADPLDSFTSKTLSRSFFSTSYHNDLSLEHTGVDIMTSAGTAVYSICDGSVYESQDYDYQRQVRGRDQYDSYYNSRLVIRCDGTSAPFLAIYMHINSAIISGRVQKGQLIASITGSYNNSNIRNSGNDHLHFGINVNANYSCCTPYGWGIAPYNTTRAQAEIAGFRDFYDYLSTNPNFNKFPVSFFDGAGSLVAPSMLGACAVQGGFGCKKDVVKMHPHAQPSTAVFQVLRTIGQCDSVRITGLTGAYITVKGWSEGYPGSSKLDSAMTVYKSVFPAEIPLSLGHSWHLISVTSLAPVPAGQTRDVTVDCQIGGPFASTNTDIAPANGNRGSNLDAVIPKLSNGSYWAGNGSLISFSSHFGHPDTIDGYGKTKDVAKKFLSLPSKSIFQSYTSGTTCKYIELRRDDNVRQGAEVNWKPWNFANWTGVSVQLPYTVTLSDGYNIITVDTSSDNSDTRIRATCL